MKRFITSLVALAVVGATWSFAAYPKATKTADIDASVEAEGYDSYNWDINGFNDYDFTWTFDNTDSLAGFYATFKMSKDQGGGVSNYVLKTTSECTTTSNSISTSLVHTNIPPNGQYDAEIALLDTLTTNTIRSWTGKVNVKNSLFDDDDSTYVYPSVSLLDYLTKVEAAATYRQLVTALAGDVTGHYLTNVVGSVQGIPYSTTDPAIGEVFAWDGTNMSPSSAGDAILSNDQTFTGINTFTKTILGTTTNAQSLGGVAASGYTTDAELNGHTNLTLASGAHGGETDPVWGAVSNLYLPLTAGPSNVITGDLYLDDGNAASPSVFFIDEDNDSGGLAFVGGSMRLLTYTEDSGIEIAPWTGGSVRIGGGLTVGSSQDTEDGYLRVDEDIDCFGSIYVRNVSGGGSTTTVASITSTGIDFGTNSMVYTYATDTLSAGVITGTTVYATHLAGAAGSTVVANAANGQTAYGWGDHATNGYLTATTTTNVFTMPFYSIPTTNAMWLFAINNSNALSGITVQCRNGAASFDLVKQVSTSSWGTATVLANSVTCSSTYATSAVSGFVDAGDWLGIRWESTAATGVMVAVTGVAQ